MQDDRPPVDATGTELLSRIGDPRANAVGTACAMVRYVKAKIKPSMREAFSDQMLEFVLSTLEHYSYRVSDVPDFESQPEVLDTATTTWLRGFGNATSSTRKLTFREAARAVLFAIRLSSVLNKRASESPEYQRTALMPLGEELERIGSWEDFDIFRMTTLAKNRPLQPVATAVMSGSGVFEVMGIDPATFLSYVGKIEDLYQAHPYHNSLHGADAAQASFCSMHKTRSGEFSEMEKLTVIFSSLVHDVGHPGVTNDFRVRTADPEAITYNDLSVNESMHAAIAFRTLNGEDSDWCVGMSTNQRNKFRKDTIVCILGTDMAHHFEKSKLVKQAIQSNGTDLAKWEDRGLLLEWLVHTVDISNPGRPRELAEKWTDRVLEEFFAQGDRERALGHAISPLCDRHTVVRASSQVGFCQYIVMPTLNILDSICNMEVPCALAREHHDANAKLVSKQKNAG